MFAEEQPHDYSFPLRFDVYPDDFLEIESDATVDDDSFDSEGEKIKEAELLIDPLDLPCDILSEYDSFNSQDFSRDDVLFSPDNEDKVFNPGILHHEKSVKIITHVTQENKLAVSFASWLSKDFDPPFSELLVFKKVPNSMRLLPFSSENEEKVFKLDQLDLPCDILSEYDSFNSQNFSRDYVLPSPDNEDKVFNPGILSREKSVKIITRVTQEKKRAVSFASWLSEDFDPPFSELLVFKEVPTSMRLLPFSSENEEKVFKPGIYTFKKFQCCSLSELSHLGLPVFKVNLIFLSLMKIFHLQNGKNTPLLDVLLFHFYPP
nr:hypothetical protein [Tanacetum cinerariifolium]